MSTLYLQETSGAPEYARYRTQENAYLQAEIDSLNSQIVEQTKVTRVEEVATKEYGMVYPTSDNCIVINENEESSTSLAASIRSEAYN